MASRELLLDEQEQVDLAVDLARNNLFGVKENPDDYITLKSKRRAPHYLDIRPGISSAHTRDSVATALVSLAQAGAIRRGCDYPHDAYAHVAGTPEAITSYMPKVAELAGVSLLQPRVDIAKASGNKTPVLGRYNQGDIIAAFDDVVTDGASKIDAIRGLGSAGLTVVDYFVVLDREEGGAPQVLAETSVEITPALGVSNMVTILRAEGLINQTQYDNVAEYIGQYGDPAAKDALGVTA